MASDYLVASSSFRAEVCRAWRHALPRRSQRTRMNWDRFNRTVLQYIPRCRKLHPYPEERFFASHLRQEPYAVVPLVRICARGRPQGPSLARPLGVYRVMAKLNRLALWIRSMCVFLHPGIGENQGLELPMIQWIGGSTSDLSPASDQPRPIFSNQWFVVVNTCSVFIVDHTVDVCYVTPYFLPHNIDRSYGSFSGKVVVR